MGSAASKVPKRAFPKAMPAQRSRPAERTEVDQAAEATVPGLSKAVEAAPKFERAAPGQFHAEPPSPEQEQDFLLQLKREGVKDSELGSFLDKLGGAIAGKQISTQDLKVS